MRELKLLPLVFFAGFALACASDDGDSNNGGKGGSGAGPGGNTGGTSSTGGTSTGSGGNNTGTGGSGGGGPVGNAACVQVFKAADPANGVIDDFEGDPGEGLPQNDGRAGEWAFGSHHNTAGVLGVFGDDGGNHYLDFSNLNTPGEGGDPPLTIPETWDPMKPWGQWASASTPLVPWVADGYNCYDASIFTGIKFRAKSGDGDDQIALQVNVVDETLAERVDEGATHRGPVHTLTSEWQEFKVPFTAITQPTWIAGSFPELVSSFNPAALNALSFVVRSVQPEEAEGTEGESLLAYEIWIDDLEFYKE